MESNSASSRNEEVFRIARTAENSLREAVERELLSFLRPRIFQAWTRQAAAGEGIFWEQLFTSARPPLCDCGGAVSVLISAPEQFLDLLKTICLKTTGVEPTTLPSAGDRILVCYEMDRLPLSRVALYRLKNNRDLLPLARRLQTRTDLPWSAVR